MSRFLTSSEVEYFGKLLKDYQLHESVLALFRQSNFAVIAGPAGAGKDTLRDNLIQKYPDKYLPVLSTTTRPPRLGEADGVTYNFEEIEEVKKGLLEHSYFQANLIHDQQVSCLDIQEIKKLSSNQYGLSILITETEQQLRNIKPDIKTIFLIPPTFTELIKRMQSERLLNEEEVARRIKAAHKELTDAIRSPDYYCLVTDTIENVLIKAHEYLQHYILDKYESERAKNVMGTILKEMSE